MPYRGFVRSSSQGPPHLFKNFVFREKKRDRGRLFEFLYSDGELFIQAEESLELNALRCFVPPTRGKKIGRLKCLLIRHSLFIFFWKVPRFKHKTDRECCRELSLLDDSSQGQSACGKSLRETRIVQNSQTITVSIHRFAYSYVASFFPFFEQKGKRKKMM